MGGDKMDEAIIAYIRRNHNLLVGESSAWPKPTGFVCIAPALREDPGGCESADHPKLPAWPRPSCVRDRLFGSGFAGLGGAT
jgi:hypothetical protein